MPLNVTYALLIQDWPEAKNTAYHLAASRWQSRNQLKWQCNANNSHLFHCGAGSVTIGLTPIWRLFLVCINRSEVNYRMFKNDDTVKCKTSLFSAQTHSFLTNKKNLSNNKIEDIKNQMCTLLINKSIDSPVLLDKELFIWCWLFEINRMIWYLFSVAIHIFNHGRYYGW